MYILFTEICISCGSVAVVASHPLFQGGLCRKCKVNYFIQYRHCLNLVCYINFQWNSFFSTSDDVTACKVHDCYLLVTITSAEYSYNACENLVHICAILTKKNCYNWVFPLEMQQCFDISRILFHIEVSMQCLIYCVLSTVWLVIMHLPHFPLCLHKGNGGDLTQSNVP